MSQANVQTVQALYAAFGRGDVPAMLGLLSEDVVWDHDTPSFGMPWYEPRTGHAGVAQFFSELARHTVIHRFEPFNFLVGGNQVAVPLHLEIEVKGRRIADLEIHLFTFDDAGRISRFAHVLDRHAQVSAWRGQQP